ncbi:MAG TPA: helix-turn-helix domain-containing protein [bacterium]|nr:helix-turn-helix domain-containing protein [bacterium]
MSLGSELRKAREAKRTRLDQISAKTRIPLKYLEALESDQLDLFPSQAHAKGFIRAYAKVVEADPEIFLAQFRAQVAPAVVKITPPHPEHEGPSGFPLPFLKKKSLPIRRERLRDEDFDPESQAQEPGQVARKLEKPPEAPRGPRRPLPLGLLLGILLALAVVAGWLGRGGVFLKRMAGAWPKAAVAQGPAPVSKDSAAPVPARGDSGRGPLADKYQHLILKGLDQSWVLVTMDDGQSSSEIDLAPGEVKSYRALRNFKLKIGNAGGVDASLNGKPLGFLGVTGQVVELSLPGAGAGS